MATKTEICNFALSLIGNERNQLSDFTTDTGKIKDQCDLHYDQTLEELCRMHTWNCCKKRDQLVETVTLITDSNDVEFTYSATVNTKAQFTNSTPDDYIQWNSTLGRWERDDSYSVSFSAVYYNEGTEDIPSTTGWKKVSDDTDAGFTLTLTYDFGWEKEYILPSDCLRPVFLTNTTESQRFLQPMIDWAVEVDRILANYSPVYLLYIKTPLPAEMDTLFLKAFYHLLASKLAIPIAGDEDMSGRILDKFNNFVIPEARRINAFEGKKSPTVDSEWLESTYTSPSNLGSSWPPFGSSTWVTAFPWS